MSNAKHGYGLIWRGHLSLLIPEKGLTYPAILSSALKWKTQPAELVAVAQLQFSPSS